MPTSLSTPGAQINDPKPHSPLSRSTFKPSYRNLVTARFGEYLPFFAMETVANEKDSLHSIHNLQTMNLKSPLLSGLAMKKDYFSVPYECILPKNWEKVFVHPNIGDDVTESVNCVVRGFNAFVWDAFQKMETRFRLSMQDSPEVQLTNLLKYLIFGEYFYSHGSLLAVTEYRLDSSFKTGFTFLGKDYEFISYDKMFDTFISHLVNLYSSFPNSRYLLTLTLNTFEGTPGETYTVAPDPTIVGGYGIGNVISFRRMLELIREHPAFSIDSIVDEEDLVSQALADIYSAISQSNVTASTSTDIPFNFGWLAAYQLVCAHVYSNDKVDYIYSADLFREYIGSIITDFTGNQPKTFVYNGVTYQYDWLSGEYLKFMLSYDLVNLNDHYIDDVLSYLAAIFNFNNSMRFFDYFTGSRTTPLAVGDTNVVVDANKVSVIDVTKKIQAQRFYNAVQKLGRKFSNYLSGEFGSTPGYDYHNPAFLAHTSDEVGVNVTDNTGTAQMSQANSRTGRFDAMSNNYAFEFDSDRPSVVLGICYFDLPRIYSTATNRNLLHADRFDMFNPHMQFVGDQAVYRCELSMLGGNDLTPFGYQLRNMEYKERVSVASGGFVENLPSWIFLANADREIFNHVSSGFIRSRSEELDPFFVSLNGWSRGSYFHFILAFDNNVVRNSPMVYQPQILG